MKSVRITALLVLAAAAGLLILASAANSQVTVAPKLVTVPPAKVVFLDVAEVFQTYKKSSNILQKAQDDHRGVGETLRARYDALKKLKAELDILVPGTDAYREKKQE